MVLKDGFVYKIAKADDFTDGQISSVTRSHRRSAFSGCWLCFVMRSQRLQVLVLFTKLQGGQFISIMRFHGWFVFSGCRLCSVM